MQELDDEQPEGAEDEPEPEEEESIPLLWRCSIGEGAHLESFEAEVQVQRSHSIAHSVKKRISPPWYDPDKEPLFPARDGYGARLERVTFGGIEVTVSLCLQKS